jgi:diguanylate cyclase (GGDEF)-like protein/PAS domain S-box-containing protein
MTRQNKRPNNTPAARGSTLQPNVVQALRQQAEERIASETLENIKALSPEEMQRTLHELRVHQIELEMQNEELRRMQVELDASRAHYFDLYDLAPVGYCTISEQGLILQANLTATTLLGVARGVHTTQPIFSRFILKEDQDLYYQLRKLIMETGEPQSCELRMKDKFGSIFWAHLSATAAKDADDVPVLRAVLNDVTQLKTVEEKLEAANIELQTAFDREQKFAQTDALTGINNRRHLFERAEHEYVVASRYQQPLSVIMFDIDKFKNVNDTFGHAVGDQVLQRVAQAACEELRSADVIGRYGGEEFVIVLPMTKAQQAYPLAERIRVGVAAIRVPTEKGDANVTLSIGIVDMIHGEQNESAEALIRRADTAMYSAKHAGRNRTEIGGKRGALSD